MLRLDKSQPFVRHYNSIRLTVVHVSSFFLLERYASWRTLINAPDEKESPQNKYPAQGEGENGKTAPEGKVLELVYGANINPV